MKKSKITPEMDKMRKDMQKMMHSQTSQEKRAAAYTTSSLVRTRVMTQQTVQMIYVKNRGEKGDGNVFDTNFQADNKRPNSPTPKCKGCNIM